MDFQSRPTRVLRAVFVYNTITPSTYLKRAAKQKQCNLQEWKPRGEQNCPAAKRNNNRRHTLHRMHILTYFNFINISCNLHPYYIYWQSTNKGLPTFKFLTFVFYAVKLPKLYYYEFLLVQIRRVK